MPMLALLAAAAQLMIVVPHDAAARGQLRALEPFADRAQLVLALGEGNTVADSAIDSLLRWPELVAVEIVPPLSVRDAGLLSRLKRLARQRYLNYQSMLKQWVAERLEKELQ